MFLRIYLHSAQILDYCYQALRLFIGCEVVHLYLPKGIMVFEENFKSLEVCALETLGLMDSQKSYVELKFDSFF